MRLERAALLTSLSLSFLLIAACGSNPVGDGAPRSGSNMPRNLPGNAIPKDEPRSRYGNGPVYSVYGTSYRVMDSSHGYQERGVASWYGKKFHGRKTSSQERYDMYAMTAAHKSLPLPTYVRVRNLKNNRSIVVKVNDRGPFVDNRLIDLSYSAALKLDLVRAGTGLVEVTAISFDDPPPTTTAASPAKSAAAGRTKNAKIFVQVGAFGEQDNAQRRYQMLRNNGLKHAFVHADRQQGPTLYRVRIGPIANVAQYDRLIDQLQDLGITDTQLVAN